MPRVANLNDYKIIKKVVDADNMIDNDNDSDLIYLGSHIYSSMPGMSWRTEYWVGVSKDNRTFSLYCTDEGSEDPDEKNLYEIYDAAGLIEYLNDVGFELSEDHIIKLNLDI